MDPEALSRISGLELRARHVVEGYLVGIHRSPYHGLNVEFAEHRPYSPGQELKHIDWKLWARSDRFYVKLFEEETNVRARFLMDCSGSMGYRSGAMSKYDYGATLAASLAHLLLMQQDAVGLAMVAGRLLGQLPPSANPAHLRPFCRMLEEHRPAGETDLGPLPQRLADGMGRRGLVVLVSDLIAPAADVTAAVRRLRYEGHAVVLAHVVDAAEEEFPFDGRVRFEGLESGRGMVTDARQIRAAYRRSFERFCRRVESACLELGADYLRARTDRPPGAVLARFLSGPRPGS